MGFSQSVSHSRQAQNNLASPRVWMDGGALLLWGWHSTHVCETLVFMGKHPSRPLVHPSARLCASASENRSEQQREQREWCRERVSGQLHFGGAFVVPKRVLFVLYVVEIWNGKLSRVVWEGGRKLGRKWRCKKRFSPMIPKRFIQCLELRFVVNCHTIQAIPIHQFNAPTLRYSFYLFYLVEYFAFKIVSFISFPIVAFAIRLLNECLKNYYCT